MKKVLPIFLSLIFSAASCALALEATLASGEVEVTLEAADFVVLEKDYTISIFVTAPPTFELEFPDLRDRFRGFSLAEGFSREPRTLPDGRVVREHRWRLVPIPAAEEYRLAPFALNVGCRGVITKPVRFTAAERDASIAGDIEIKPRSYRIPPTPREILRFAAIALAAAAIAYFIYAAFHMIRRKVRLIRMSPRERAFAELDALLRRDLPAHGRYKDFYVELTHVVRRYIERSHGLRAPEQTTEEFLAAAAVHPRFTPETIARLKQFLSSADLVKFAGLESSPTLAHEAVNTARDYINSDNNV